MLRFSPRFLSPSWVATSRAAPVVYTRKMKRRLANYRVKVEDLCWCCDPSQLPFRTTAEVRPTLRIIGQEKALRALTMGIQLEGPGYNVFVCGLPGTGRMTAVRHVLSRYRRDGYRPVDLCYVPDFDAPEHPRLLVFPAGEGANFRHDVHSLLSRVERLRGAAAPRKDLRALLGTAIPALRSKYPGEKVAAHLDRLHRAILDRGGRCPPEEAGVNLILQSSGKSPPVVMPSALTYGALMGVIDRGSRPSGGSRAASFAGIRAGAVVEAAGGVLVLQAADLLSAKGSFAALKGCLEHGQLRIRDIDPSTGDLRSSLSPEPIPLKLKVILVGDYQTYDYLFEEDADFIDLFKVRVDFDSEVDLSRGSITRDYPGFIARVVRDEGLRRFTASAVARVIAFGVRRAGRKKKITTQFSAIADLVREASFWAGRAGRRLVLGCDVETALRESLNRLNLVETKMSEMIVDGTILIDTAGSRIGQVNGLAVYDQGDYVFGKPSRITAETSVGQGGIINIERESGFSGKSHDKGIQILGGYLRSRFAQRRPLSLTASVCFEQSYSGVDGDSASSTEIYAILSSLSGLPIRQDLAVTGSMNQKGDIQPIGGVNEKIEGFFDCVHTGKYTGREGVIIPRRNLPDLLLRDDVVRAVKKGRFHIYAIRTVEEGIEILTGVPAGRPRRGGGYAPGTVFDLADRRLEQIAQGLRQAQAEGEE